MYHVLPPEAGRPFALIEATAAGASLLDLPADAIETLYKRHGALLFRGFGGGVETLGSFAGRFCATSVMNESPDRHLFDRDANIQSVNGGADAFPLHPELSREPWKPDVCFFHCLKAPASGGETTVCDGVELVRRLPAAVRDGLSGRRFVYLQPMPPWHLKFWFGTETPEAAQLTRPPAHVPYYFLRINGHLVRAFNRPALHRPLFTDEPAFGSFLLFARYQNGRYDFPILDDGYAVPHEWVEAVKEVSDRLTVPVKWRKGDLLMLDNSRFMHGRNAIVDTSERLIASYFGYLRFAPPNPEEPADPIWRRENFVPPLPPVA